MNIKNSGLKALIKERHPHHSLVHLSDLGSFCGLLIPTPGVEVVWSSVVGGLHEVPVAMASAVYLPIRMPRNSFISDMVSNIYDHTVVKGFLKRTGLRTSLSTVPPGEWPDALVRDWDLAGESIVMADGWIPVCIAKEPEAANLVGFAGKFAVLVHENGG